MFRRHWTTSPSLTEVLRSDTVKKSRKFEQSAVETRQLIKNSVHFNYLPFWEVHLVRPSPSPRIALIEDLRSFSFDPLPYWDAVLNNLAGEPKLQKLGPLPLHIGGALNVLGDSRPLSTSPCTYSDVIHHLFQGIFHNFSM